MRIDRWLLSYVLPWSQQLSHPVLMERQLACPCKYNLDELAQGGGDTHVLHGQHLSAKLAFCFGGWLLASST